MTVTFFVITFDPLTSKCKGTFFSPSCIYVWNMKAVRWKLLKLLCQNQSVDKVQLWPWPLDPKMYRHLPFAILYLCMTYESCTLKTTQVIESEPKCWQSSVVTLTFDPKMYRYLPLTILHLCMKYESCMLKTSPVIVSEPKCWQSSVVTLTFWPQNV